jgi:hypothetical protein
MLQGVCKIADIHRAWPCLYSQVRRPKWVRDGVPSDERVALTIRIRRLAGTAKFSQPILFVRAALAVRKATRSDNGNRHSEIF